MLQRYLVYSSSGKDFSLSAHSVVEAIVKLFIDFDTNDGKLNFATIYPPTIDYFYSFDPECRPLRYGFTELTFL
jgi:predicted membrane GTPase involved in stress response